MDAEVALRRQPGRRDDVGQCLLCARLQREAVQFAGCPVTTDQRWNRQLGRDTQLERGPRLLLLLGPGQGPAGHVLPSSGGQPSPDLAMGPALAAGLGHGEDTALLRRDSRHGLQILRTFHGPDPGSLDHVSEIHSEICGQPRVPASCGGEDGVQVPS